MAVMASQALFSQTLIRPPTPTTKSNSLLSPPNVHLRPTPTPNQRLSLSVSAAVQPLRPLSDSPTRTLTTLAAVTLAAFKSISVPAVRIAAQHATAGLSKSLDIYSGVLMVRVLLSWFPNIHWDRDRQPLSAEHYPADFRYT